MRKNRFCFSCYGQALSNGTCPYCLNNNQKRRRKVQAKKKYHKNYFDKEPIKVGKMIDKNLWSKK